MRTGRLSPAEASALEAMWAAGASYKVIARRLDRDPERIRHIVTHARAEGRLDVPCRYHRGPVVDDQGRVHATQVAAAAALGISQTSMWRRLARPDSGWRREGRT